MGSYCKLTDLKFHRVSIGLAYMQEHRVSNKTTREAVGSENKLKSLSNKKMKIKKNENFNIRIKSINYSMSEVQKITFSLLLYVQTEINTHMQ